MREGGMLIGGVNNLDAAGDRIRLYRAKVLSPQEAKSLGYQTWWPAIIRDPDVRPRIPNRAELYSLTTHKADSRIYPVFFRVQPSTMAELEAMRSGFDDRTPRLTDGPVLELAPGIKAQLSIIRQDPDRPTAAWNREIDNGTNPKMKHGDSIGIHHDGEKNAPIATRYEEDRRGIVVMNSDSGPSTHEALFVRSYNVFDLAEMEAAGNGAYIPMNPDLMPRLGKLIDGREEIVAVTMNSSEAYALSAVNSFHDGGPNRLRRAYTAVTHETSESWSQEALLASSIFN